MSGVECVYKTSGRVPYRAQSCRGKPLISAAVRLLSGVRRRLAPSRKRKAYFSAGEAACAVTPANRPAYLTAAAGSEETSQGSQYRPTPWFPLPAPFHDPLQYLRNACDLDTFSFRPARIMCFVIRGTVIALVPCPPPPSGDAPPDRSIHLDGGRQGAFTSARCKHRCPRSCIVTPRVKTH